MRIKKAVLFFLLIISIETALNAENYPDWEGYPPMLSLVDIIEFRGLIYTVCKSGIICYYPDTGEYKLFYKNHGLAASNILSISSTSKSDGKNGKSILSNTLDINSIMT